MDRDAEPDWTPYLQPQAPEGAPNVLMIVGVDTEAVADGEIVTQPGFFSLCGDGLSVGRDTGSRVKSDYTQPFEFTGGTIERVVVVRRHDKEELAYIARDWRRAAGDVGGDAARSAFARAAPRAGCVRRGRG